MLGGAIEISRRGVLALGAGTLAAPAFAMRPQRVLFLGNSFTRHHGVPVMVDAIADDNATALHIAALVYDGLPLIQHVADQQINQLVFELQPDILVLQEHSVEPLTAAGRERSAQAIRLLRPLAPRMVLFPAWPRRADHPFYQQQGAPPGPVEMAQLIQDHHLQMAAAHDAEFADVTGAWMRALAKGMRLHADDGYHAAPSGAWLAASVLAKAIGIDVQFIERVPDGMHVSTARFLTAIGLLT